VEHLLLAQAVAFAGLIAAVGEYAAIIRRRAQSRVEYQVATIAGLQGLVRLEAFAEARPTARRWSFGRRVWPRDRDRRAASNRF
jgi:hypothetical protein